MVKKWKPAGEIKVETILHVSATGEGLALFLPKRLCETYDIIGGDQVKVELKTLFKRDWTGEEKGEERR